MRRPRSVEMEFSAAHAAPLQTRRAPGRAGWVLRGSLKLFLLLLLAGPLGCSVFRATRSEKDLVAARQLALRGSEAMRRGRVEEAERCFQDAISRYPQDERCHVLLAELRKRQGQTEQSTEHLERAVQLSGGDPKLLAELGEQRLHQGEDLQAMLCARKALRQDAANSRAWVLYGRLLRREKNADGAINAFHRALQIEPQQREVLLELAEVYLEEGRFERCLSTLDARPRGLGEANSVGDAEALRGFALAGMERHADAVAALAEAERRGARSPEIYLQLAESHFRSGSPASARLALGEGLRISPQDTRFSELEIALQGDSQGAVTRKRR